MVSTPTAQPRSVLVVVTRRIGDVLLATPLIRSLKSAWPETEVDALVFEGTQGAITANRDLRRILTVPERPSLPTHLALVVRLLRRYDLALSLLPGDRSTMYAFLAGRRRVGLLLPVKKEAWKRRLLHRWIPFDTLNTHTVLMYLALADALGITRCKNVVLAWSAADAQRVNDLLGPVAGRPLAVLHTYPKFNYKLWRREGWIEAARHLSARGYRVVLTGGNDSAELEYIARLMRGLPADTLNLAGRLTLAGTACLVSRAAVFVGADTAITHMAAAAGVPTIALYGPTDPVKWGPWPGGYAGSGSPWRRLGSQSVGRVRLIQGNAACAPCHKEGCDRQVASFSDCLQQLPAARVIAAIESALDER
jgi:lipopolysaccharide heptosyltransferase III